jgi:hypothetical protein
MVVGADHCGRAGVGVWRDAASRPLTARHQRPDHGRRSCSTRPTAWRRGRWAPGPAGAADHPALPGPSGLGYQPGLGPVPLGHREQFVAGQATPFGLADDGDGGLGVGLAGGGGHRQPQPVAHRSDQPRLGLSRCFLWAVAGMGGVAGGGWPAGVRVVLAVVVGGGSIARCPAGPPGRPGRPARRPPPCPGPRRAAWEGLLGRQERACAAIARALARQPSKICVPRPFEDESMHYRLSVSS